MTVTQQLYQKFGFPERSETPRQIFQILGAFWPHFALHKRPCDKTGKMIISPYDENCPYPVWHREEWLTNSNPPTADFNPDKPFFDQLWDLFQKCPIPHNNEVGNQNCEYTEDWFYSRNCYLSHSGVKNEDLAYCFRVLGLKDCQFCVFAFNSERSTDLINSSNCYNVTYAINSKQCNDSAFLYDCRNCKNCLFSWNLRNKEYCILNKQLTKEEYEKEKVKYNFASRQLYEAAKKKFWELLQTEAWWKHIELEQCENSSGDRLEKCKNAENCYYVQESEDCANVFRAFGLKDNLNAVSPYKSELIYMSAVVQDNCYNVKFCAHLVQCKNMEYSTQCLQCQDCFGCCGLIGKKFYIFNKPYSETEYQRKVEDIKSLLQSKGEYGEFFPPYFAATSYDETLSGFHWPLSPEEQKTKGFRVKTITEKNAEEFSPLNEIPDSPLQTDDLLLQKSFWDPIYQRPFKIRKADVTFCKENNVPLPNEYYLHRLKNNFSHMFCNGEMRETKCAKAGMPLMTSLPEYLNNRILSEDAYLKILH